MNNNYFCAVKLHNLEVQLTIPAIWVYNLNSAKNIKHGYKRDEIFKIFHSKDMNKTPDFTLQVKTEFDPDQDACYSAKIYTADGK